MEAVPESPRRRSTVGQRFTPDLDALHRAHLRLVAIQEQLMSQNLTKQIVLVGGPHAGESVPTLNDLPPQYDEAGITDGATGDKIECGVWIGFTSNAARVVAYLLDCYSARFENGRVRRGRALLPDDQACASCDAAPFTPHTRDCPIGAAEQCSARLEHDGGHSSPPRHSVKIDFRPLLVPLPAAAMPCNCSATTLLATGCQCGGV